MPQPLTHYLIVRKSIPQEFWPMWADYKPYFGLGSVAPDLFYFPTIPFLTDSRYRDTYPWGDMANPMHAIGSYDMFCNLLSTAKKNNNFKQLAFSIGYYSHVIADCIFHPYVYRETKDYWFSVDILAELKHKKEEFLIDRGVIKEYYSTNCINRIDITCKDSNDSSLLDFDILDLMNTAFLETYGNIYSSNIPLDENHPIQQAYSSLMSFSDSIFRGEKICLFGSLKVGTTDFKINTHINLPISINVGSVNTNFEIDKNSFKIPYKVNLHELSPHNLCEIATMESRDIFTKTMDFWNTTDTYNAKGFFAENKVDFLGKSNFNLDTGLPAEYNSHHQMTTKENHFDYMANELSKQMSWFENKLSRFNL